MAHYFTSLSTPAAQDRYGMWKWYYQTRVWCQNSIKLSLSQVYPRSRCWSKFLIRSWWNITPHSKERHQRGRRRYFTTTFLRENELREIIVSNDTVNETCGYPWSQVLQCGSKYLGPRSYVIVLIFSHILRDTYFLYIWNIGCLLNHRL